MKKRQLFIYVVLVIILGNTLNARSHRKKVDYKNALKEISTGNTNLLLPTATISGTTSVCQNASSPLITFAGSGGTAPYTFTYRINTGVLQTVTTTGTNNSVTVSVDTSTSGTYTYNMVSVHDSTVPKVESNVVGNAAVTVKAQADASLNSSAVPDTFNSFPVFKICSNQTTNIDFFNASTTKTNNLSYSISWGDGTQDFTSTNWNSVSHSYEVGLWTLVYTIVAQNGCNITKTFKVFVGNNPAVGLGNPGNTDVCISSSLTFPITGTGNNPPGTTYIITFNDGSSPITYNHPPPSSVTHTFLKTSCGTTSTVGSTYSNSFYASIVALNPCDKSSATVVPIRISTAPIANFSYPQNVKCTNSQICFTNTSTDGNAASSNSCLLPKIIWSISPNTGYVLNSGSLGDDFGSTNTNSWTSGSATMCPTFTSTGNYSITMKVGNRCGIDVITKNICIEAPLTPQFTLSSNSGCTPLAITTTNTTNEVNTCTATTYLWSVTYAATNCGTPITAIPNQTTKNASYNFTVPGTYTIKLTATNSCGSFSSTQSVEVKKPPTITSINGIQTNYCGTANIAPTATVSSCAPATSSLTYAWSFPGGNPATSNAVTPGTINYNTTGNYTVSLLVTNECGVSTTATQSFSVIQSPTITNTNLSQSICSGTSSAVVNLTADTVGTIYSWTATATAGISGFQTTGTSNSIPSSTISTINSTAGTVTYVVTPKIGTCMGTPVNFVVNVNPGPSIVTQPISSAVCIGENPVQLTVAVNGTTGTPTYQWYSNISNTTTAGTLIAGAINSSYSPVGNVLGKVYYYCVIILPTGGCSNLTSNIVSVTVTTPLLISTQPTPTQSLCTGVTINSPLTVSFTGGAGSTSYQWYANTSGSNTGGTAIAGADNSTYTPPIYTVASDYFYYVTINSTGTGCGSTTSNVAKVTVYDAPTIKTQPTPLQVLCQGDAPSSLEVEAIGGNGTFSYQWYSSNNNNTVSGVAISGATNTSYLPVETIGTKYYYCIVSQTTTSGCVVVSDTASIQVGAAPTITSQPVSSSICLGGTPTILSITISNGTGTPTYQWYINSTSSNSGGTILPSATNASYAPQKTVAGTTYYYCTITYPLLSSGCNVIITNPATVTINENPIIANTNVTICSTESFVIAPTNSGGNIVPSGTTYTWSNPVISPIGSVTGASVQVIPQTNVSQSLTNNTTTTATVTYTVTPNAGNCIGNSFTVSVIVKPAVKAVITVNNNKCFGINVASISTSASGGIPFLTGFPYHYSWVGPNGFTATSSTISNLEPGNYDLIINDSGGCPFVKSYLITEPAEIAIVLNSKKDVSCFSGIDGSIDIGISGGIANYAYAWKKNGNPYATSQDISNLSVGNYQVVVTDSNNCGPQTASFLIQEPPLLVVSLLSKKDVLCFGGTSGEITVTASGGSPTATGYSFLWNGPNGYTSTIQNPTNLMAGTYNLKVTDNQSCSKSLTVTISQSPEIKIIYSTTPISCYGADNATITAAISGGIPPFQYQWSNLATTLNQTNLSAGDYTLEVTDAKGCLKSQTISILQAPIFMANPIKKDITCFGAHDGSVNLNLVGGKAPLSLVWSDGSTAGLTRNNLGSGTYTATISDGTPCQIIKTFTILEPQLMVLGANLTNALQCDEVNSGSIALLVSGGTSPFNYLWSNGSVAKDLNNIPAGNYRVTVTDARGCVKEAQYSINRPSPIVTGVDTKSVFNCETKEVKQTFIANVSGGVPPYQLNWSNGLVSGLNNEVMHTSQNGTVLLNVTDKIGCQSSYSFNVEVPVLGYAGFNVNSFAFSTYGLYSIEDSIQFTNTATGNFSFVSWDFGDNSFSNEINPIHVYKKEGTYVVKQKVTYPFGCIYTYILQLEIKKGYNLIPPTGFTPNDDGINDYFAPVFSGLKDIHFDVYDTWGGLIYSESGENIKGWDGKIKDRVAENGNYYFKIVGVTFYGTVVKAQGALVLIK